MTPEPVRRSALPEVRDRAGGAGVGTGAAPHSPVRNGRTGNRKDEHE